MNPTSNGKRTYPHGAFPCPVGVTRSAMGTTNIIVVMRKITRKRCFFEISITQEALSMFLNCTHHLLVL
ncbi:Decarboxylase orsB [Fusarium oxysporum f. sp. albedinis]|nr:Decarboxylase orsB [Fusarium oxysporum f. sp. albedinis]